MNIDVIWTFFETKLSGQIWQKSEILSLLLQSKLFVANLFKFHVLRNKYIAVKIVNLWQLDKILIFWLFAISDFQHLENGLGGVM